MRTVGALRSAVIGAILVVIASPSIVRAGQASMSTWDASSFRVWGYIPYWASSSQINGFGTNGMYNHVSDVLYFGAVRPTATGNLVYGSSSYATILSNLRTQSSTHGFNLHLSMMEVSGGSITDVWTSIVNTPAYRANFVNNLKTLMLGSPGQTPIVGFNFDWERPNSASLWGNYTQLARELGEAFKDPATPQTHHWEVSVCDYGSTDFRWDDTALFDAKVYDQLFIMIYHLGASSANTYSNQKLNLTQQGADKAFSNDQLTLGFGTWGTGGPATVTLATFVAAHPDLPYDQTSISGTYPDLNGTMRTGTWTIESRKQLREKTQVALDRGMPGIFSWTLHYDATNELGLHRVAHHYIAVKRNTPDLNLDGRVDGNDATTLANNMGMVLANTGMTTAAQFDAYYLAGNWEKGDHNGDGFVNQLDADWLASRFNALGITLPDRLAYTGTFESFDGSMGLSGRWRAGRDAQNKLRETSNFKQESAGFLPWTGTGVGSERRSDNFVTIRNQNAAEVAAGINGHVRQMQADLSAPINLGTAEEIYLTLTVRENTGTLLPSQLASSNRKLSLELLNSAGVSQYDFVFRGLQGDVSILSQADAAGQDVSIFGFAPDTTYLVVGKISGNGSAANTLQLSFFPDGSFVGDFTNPAFAWMLTAHGGAGYDPLITSVQFTSLADGNFTVSNLWIGSALAIPEPASMSMMLLGALLGTRRRARRQR